MPDHETDVEGQVMLPPQPLKAMKGRGAVTNLQGRYEVNGREAYDDGWQRDEDEDAPAGWKTHVTDEAAKTILSRNTSPDLPFSVSLNPYRGCEHGCIYCFARPTHSYLGLSPGLDFESKIFAKVNAPELLRRELSKASYVPDSIALGVNTDAYQPCERERQLTRRVLEVLQECEHPVGLITKSALIERDIDILSAMAAKRQAVVSITVTTLDPAISRTLEPRAAAPARRQSSFFSAEMAICAEELGSESPRASMAEAMVLAVYMPPQEPGPGIEQVSTIFRPASSSLCAECWPTASKTETMSHSFLESGWIPGRIVPP